MRRLALIVTAAAAAVAMHAAPASAQANRTFVSGLGDDNNPCSRASPCRSFGRAISLTNAAGELTILDSAGYGSVTINKAISITAEGIEAAITTNAAIDGITISAGSNDVINLRGLTFTGGNIGNNGINFSAGGSLNIENCVVSGFTGNGINLTPGASSINVSDTVVSNNAGGGIALAPTASAAAFFERVQAIGNAGAGFLITGVSAPAGAAIKATAANSVATGNGEGFHVTGALNGATAALMVVDSGAYNNNSGLIADQQGTIFLAGSKVYGNTIHGFFINGGSIKTFSNNSITDANNSGNLTPIAKQ